MRRVASQDAWGATVSDGSSARTTAPLHRAGLALDSNHRVHEIREPAHLDAAPDDRCLASVRLQGGASGAVRLDPRLLHGDAPREGDAHVLGDRRGRVDAHADVAASALDDRDPDGIGAVRSCNTVYGAHREENEREARGARAHGCLSTATS
ncbi:MAG: hypothetical protein U0414_24955 [Polyangiaceae bacterium]